MPYLLILDVNLLGKNYHFIYLFAMEQQEPDWSIEEDEPRAESRHNKGRVVSSLMKAQPYCMRVGWGEESIKLLK